MTCLRCATFVFIGGTFNPDRPLKALKALALLRSQKIEETLALCDEILASKPTDDGTLSAMMHVLRGLGRRTLHQLPCCFPGLNIRNG